MISRFNQLLLAFTTVTPLLLSIATVLILLYPSEYINAWGDLLQREAVSNSSYWWVSNIFVLIFVASWIWTKRFLNGLMKKKKGVKSITLSSLQNKPLNNLLPVVAMLPPWIMLIMRDEWLTAVMVMSIIVALALAYVISRQGYTSLTCLLCGYKVYEGQNTNGMRIHLLSKRTWGNYKDIHDIVLLSDNYALIVQ